MVERFGLFVIIVLGEVVVGVVTGLSEAGHGLTSIATGLVGLMIGFGIWWTYFDYIGRRRPRMDGGRLLVWMSGHLPVTMAIAASGAAMVTLVEHAGDGRAPEDSAWLLSGSVALALVGLILVMNSLCDAQRLRSLYRPVTLAMVAAAGAALLAGWWRPAPWLLALMLVLILLAVWFTAVVNWLRLQDPDQVRPNAG
jgi:low temperature requirement protein LtrA